MLTFRRETTISSYEVLCYMCEGMSELLDEEALNKLTKSDLVQYALKVSNLTSHINSLSDKLNLLTERIVKTESEIVFVKNANVLLKEQNELLESRLDRVERLQIQDSQYLRNKQVELKGFPDAIDDSNLKAKVCELLSNTGLGLCPMTLISAIAYQISKTS